MPLSGTFTCFTPNKSVKPLFFNDVEFTIDQVKNHQKKCNTSLKQELPQALIFSVAAEVNLVNILVTESSGIKFFEGFPLQKQFIPGFSVLVFLKPLLPIINKRRRQDIGF